MADESVVEKKEIDPSVMTPEQMEFGVDNNGFWIFRVHESRGLQVVLGFLEQMKDIVKVHYAQKMREAQEAKGIIKPKNGFRPSKWH